MPSTKPPEALKSSVKLCYSLAQKNGSTYSGACVKAQRKGPIKVRKEPLAEPTEALFPPYKSINNLLQNL